MHASEETGGDRLERYVLFDEIAVGGTATIHLARQLGAVGFSRTVAIKRLHPHYARDAEFVAMMVDEALLAARIHHPNVVAMLDTVTRNGELFLVLEYVHGDSLSKLQRGMGKGVHAPLPIAITIAIELLHGLHAAHEAVGEDGTPLGLVHRDMSPQNVLVGVDGRTRILDFGVAKAVTRLQTTEQGQIKGKFSYMAPEQLRNETLDRRCDLFASSTVLWELLTGRSLFKSDENVVPYEKILFGTIDPPTVHVPDLPPALVAIVMRGLEREREDRFATALEMATALEALDLRATTTEVGAWVTANAQSLTQRTRRLREIAETSIAPTAATGPIVDANEIPTLVEGEAVDNEGADTEIAPAPIPKSRRKAAVFAIAAVLLLGAGTASLFHRHDAAAAEAIAPNVAPFVAPGPTSTPSGVVDSVAVSIPVASALPPATIDSASATHRSNPRGNGSKGHAKGTARSAECNPGYDVGPDGVRRWKAQCLP